MISPLEIHLPVLFLDFDGVIVLDGEEAHPGCVANLNRVFKEVPGCQVVISSAWRYYHTLGELSRLLVKWGLDPEVPIAGMTALREKWPPGLVVGKNTFRELEIMSYVKSYGLSKWVGVDDLFSSPPCHPNMLLIDPKVGMSEVDASNVISTFLRQ